MKTRFNIIEKKTGAFPISIVLMMKKSGLDLQNEFEGFGITTDEKTIILDKAGNFAYLSNEYELTQEVEVYEDRKWIWKKIELVT